MPRFPSRPHRHSHLARRAGQLDVDIKRLWRRLAVTEQLVQPRFTPPTEPLPTPGNVLIFVTGVTTSVAVAAYAQAAQIHNAAFGSSGLTSTVVGELNVTTPIDIGPYSLIYIFHDRVGAFPEWISPTATSQWLSQSVQRRLILVSELFVILPGSYAEEVNQYADELGVGMALSPATSGPPNSFADAAGHYLTSGISQLEFTGASFVTGGTLLYRWNGFNPGDILRIAKMSSGSEVILCGDSAWVRSHAPNNSIFIRRLYPSAQYGGVPVQ